MLFSNYYNKNNPKELLGFLNCDINFSHRNAELGYFLDSNYSNNGYMTEAVETICSLLDNKGCNKIYLKINPDNIRSVNLAKKCNFTKEAILKRHFWNHNLKDFTDSAIFSRFPT